MAANTKKIKLASFAYSPRKSNPLHEVKGIKKIPKNTKDAMICFKVIVSLLDDISVDIFNKLLVIYKRFIPEIGFYSKLA